MSSQIQDVLRLDYNSKSKGRFATLCKRFLDVIVASFLLATLSPVLLLILCLIRITSRDFPIYSQWRIGLHGLPFRIYKFRTMKSGAHSIRNTMVDENCKTDIIFKFAQDPRITPFGQFLRTHSLDELPQLINVFKGEMSLVGPRPFSIEVFESGISKNPEYLHWKSHRHQVRPGMTGLWQVSGRNDLPPEALFRLDLQYVAQWSLKYDIAIILRTIPAVITCKGAY